MMVEVFAWGWSNTTGMAPFDNVAGLYTLHSWPVTLWTPTSKLINRLGFCLEVKGQGERGPLSDCWEHAYINREIAPFCYSHWRLSFAVKFPRSVTLTQGITAFFSGTHRCSWACVHGSVNNCLSSLERQILHSCGVCRILSDYIH